MRVLEWIVGRVHGRAEAVRTPIGEMPRYADLRWEGLDFAQATFDRLMAVEPEAWRQEIADHQTLFDRIGDRLPAAFPALKDRLLKEL
jgi:phosphoenolpyruvate carboxykinase (GTP)